MALIPSDRYPAQIDADADYPLGKARNAGSYQDGTGTPLEKDWLNDDWGFKQALLAAAAITPSGDPDKVGASQYLEAMRAIAVDSTIKRNITRALTLRALDLDGATPTSSAFLGAVSVLGFEALVVKGGANGVFAVVDMPFVNLSFVTAATLTEVRKLIAGGSRVLAIGGGGNKNAFSTNAGATWTAGGATGLTTTPTDGVWDGTQFVVSTVAGKSAHSTNGVAWAAATGGSDIIDAIDFNPQGGLAALVGGTVVAAGALIDNTRAFAVSTDHGLTWALAGSIPSSPDYVVNGYVAGNGGAEIYWLGKPDGVDQLDLFVSTDATTWIQRAAIPGFTGAFQPMLYMCQDTGLLLAVQDHGTHVSASASVDRGYTWSDLAHYNLGDEVHAIAVARGRVFATRGTRLFASDVV